MSVAAGRDGISAPFVPRMAFGKSAYSEPASFDDAVCSNRVLGIAGAAGVEAAVIAEERTQNHLVAGNKEDKEETHQVSVPWLFWDMWLTSFCHCCRNIVDSSELSN